MRFVEIKEEAQLDMQTLHRARSGLVNSRTRLINQLRAILLERGVTVAKGRRALAFALASPLEAGPSTLSPRIRMLIEDKRSEWAELDARIETSTAGSSRAPATRRRRGGWRRSPASAP